MFFGTAWGTWLLAQNKQSILIVYQILMMAFIIPLEMYIIPKFGIVGAAYSVIIAYFFNTIIALTVYKPKESFKLFFNACNPKHLFDVISYWKGNK